MIILYIIPFQSFISIQPKHYRVAAVNGFRNLCSFSWPVLKVSLSDMQSCIVFKGIAFQGLHLKSTRFYKPEAFFRFH